jgi:hypothetical protein
MARAEETLREVVLVVNRILREDLSPFRNALVAAGRPPLPTWDLLPMPTGG